jgi:hypothetical protein
MNKESITWPSFNLKRKSKIIPVLNQNKFTWAERSAQFKRGNGIYATKGNGIHFVDF